MSGPEISMYCTVYSTCSKVKGSGSRMASAYQDSTTTLRYSTVHILYCTVYMFSTVHANVGEYPGLSDQVKEGICLHSISFEGRGLNQAPRTFHLGLLGIIGGQYAAMFRQFTFTVHSILIIKYCTLK